MALDLGGGGRVPSKKKPPKKSPLIGRERELAYFKAKSAAQSDVNRAYSSGGSSGGGSGGSSRGSSRSSGGGGRSYYGGGGGGGGGGGSSAAAEEEARKKKQRALVEQYYNQGLGSLNSTRAAARPEISRAGNDVLRQLATIYGQNKAVTGTTTKDIQAIQNNVLAQLAAQQSALGRDLGNQGADPRALQSAGAGYQGDARATAGAADQFNRRLGQVQDISYGDDRSAAGLVSQSAVGQLQANYAQALAQLQNMRMQSLMGLV